MTNSDPKMPSEDVANRVTPPKKKWRQRHRILWILLWLFSGTIGLFILAIVGLFIYLNTQAGQNFVAGKIGDLTGHSIEVNGIRGSFPNHLKVKNIKLYNPAPNHTVWLELKEVRLDWSMAALFHMKIAVHNLSAKEMNVYHLPVSTQASSTSSNASSSLATYRVDAAIDQLKIDRIHVAKEVAIADVNMAFQGKFKTRNVLSFLNFTSLADLPDLDLQFNGWELNQATHLQLQTVIQNHQIQKGIFTFNAASNAAGLVERLLKSDQLTPINLNLALKGPYDHLQTQLHFDANKTYLKTNGFLDLIHSKMDLTLAGYSPAMTLNPQIHWDGWDLKAAIAGDFMAPTGKGVFNLKNLVAGETLLNQLVIHFAGKDEKRKSSSNQELDSWVKLHLMIDGLRIPGRYPTLLASDPILLDMIYHPKEKNQVVDFHLQHSLLKAVGRLFIKPTLHGSIDLALPHLNKLAAIGGVNLEGESALNLAFAMPEKAKQPIQLDLDGPVKITKGLPIAVNMIGDQGHIGLHAHILQGDDPVITLDRLMVHGKNLYLQGKGNLVNQQVDGLISLDLNNLSAFLPIIKGQSKATIKAQGSLNDLSAQLNVATQFQTLASQGYAVAPSHLNLKANLTHLPTLPQAGLLLSGDLDRFPITLQLQAGQKEKNQDYYVHLQKLDWRSLIGSANFDIMHKNFMPLGNMNLKITRLADFNKIIRQNLQGNLDVQIRTPGQDQSKVMLNLNSKLSMPGLKIGQLGLSGFIRNPIQKPEVNVKAQLTNLQLSQVKGNINLNAIGGMDNLKVTTNAIFPSLMASKGSLDTAVLLDLAKKTVALQKFNALVKGETIHLTSPAKVNFGEKMAVDHLRLSFAPPGSPLAIIDVAGMIKPKLTLNASVQNVTPAIMKPFVPDLKAQGVMNAYAKLAGSLEKPTGTVKIDARNLKMLTGGAASLPPAQFMSQINMMGTNAQMNTHVQMGNKIDTVIAGKVPLDTKGRLALTMNGNIDLGVANAVVGVFGQQVKGNVNLAMQINGDYVSPIVTGTVRLINGSFRDYAQGMSVRNMQATLIGARDHITLQSFTAKAGKGDIHAEGQVGVFQPGIPVNIHINMKEARPLVSDLLTAILDGDITISGMAKSRLDTKGIIKIKHAEINIPHSVSSSVVPLKVVRPGEKVEEDHVKTSMGPVLGLDLTIKSAGQILVQGFGLFTDMAGSLHITGTADAPSVAGGMKMQNGHIDLSGISLDFTKGVIGFKGTNVDRKIDPSLDFEVKKSVEGNTVKLLITGYASSPKITLTSSPPISQDRVLAMLLFGVDSQSLSATQMAEIGLALATLGGQSAGVDPLGTVRKGLGLDRLSLGGGSSSNENGGSTTGASVAAGKYIAKGVYVGAKQSTGNAGTQAEMQIDITKHLKATATVGTGKDSTGFVTPDNDPGSNIGLLYQFDY